MAAAILPYLPTIISALGSVGGALLSRRGSDETPIQQQQRELIDQILASVKGEGPFSDMFRVDEEAFQKSYVNPAKERFRNQIAPTIQQSFIGGQGGARATSTGLEDQLTRAGVDLDQLLNQQYASMQDAAQQRRFDALGKILGQGKGGFPGEQSFGSAAGEGLAGFLSSKAFPEGIDSILSSFNKPKMQDSLQDAFISKRKGFENDPYVYNPYTGVQQ